MWQRLWSGIAPLFSFPEGIRKVIYTTNTIESAEGKKELLGIWVGKNEGSKFWMQVVTELKNRGIEKIYVACVDGLKGFPEAINSVFPKTIVQLCQRY